MPTSTPTPADWAQTTVTVGGGSATTGSEATDIDTTVTQVDIPPGVASGTFVLTISESPPIGAPGGFTAFGQEIHIDAQGATFSAQISVTFVFDASVTGGIDPADVEMLRDGVLVADCPNDPCVSSRATNVDGDITVTVLTTGFSDWLAVVPNANPTPPTPNQVVGGYAQFVAGAEPAAAIDAGNSDARGTFAFAVVVAAIAIAVMAASGASIARRRPR